MDLEVTQRSSTSSGQLSKVDGYMLREAGGDHFSVDLMITVWLQVSSVVKEKGHEKV